MRERETKRNETYIGTYERILTGFKFDGGER